jgi:hypothetical protein
MYLPVIGPETSTEADTARSLKGYARPCKGSGHYGIRAKQLQTAMTLCVGAVAPVPSPQTIYAARRS